MALLRVKHADFACWQIAKRRKVMKLTLKKILALVAGGLAVIAFIMAFVSPLKNDAANVSAKASEVWFEDGGTIIPFIAFIVALLAGAYLIVRQFVAIPQDKKLFWVAIALLVVAAVVIFLTETFYINSWVNYMVDISSVKPTSAQITMQKELMAESLVLGTGAIFGGILAIASAACAVVAEKFVKE